MAAQGLGWYGRQDISTVCANSDWQPVEDHRGGGCCMFCLSPTEDYMNGIILSPLKFVQQAIREIDEYWAAVIQPGQTQNQTGAFFGGRSWSRMPVILRSSRKMDLQTALMWGSRDNDASVITPRFQTVWERNMFAQVKVEVMEDGTHYLQNCSHHLKESRILLNKEKIIFTLSLTHYVFTFLTYVHTFYTKGSNEWASIICKFQKRLGP